MSDQTLEEYSAHIEGAVSIAIASVEDIVKRILDMEESAIQCVDEYNIGEGVNPPGTIWFLLDQHGWFEHLIISMSRKGKKTLHIYWHWFCGYLFVIRRITRLADQVEYASNLMRNITDFAAAYGVQIVWHEPDQHGTAEPYMTR
jgi:hypothetical protein